MGWTAIDTKNGAVTLIRMKAPVLAAIVFWSLPAMGQDYATFYGDGMRFYAQGHYNEALENLYRAYAAKPSPDLLSLIIRTHDFAGQCSAVERQVGLFKDLFPRQKAPTAQVCENPGTLEIKCTPHASQVMINHTMRAHCGTSVKVPPGKHTVHSEELNEAKVFVVEAGSTTVATLQLVPKKWSARVDPIQDSLPYTAIKSSDGLFEIWVRSSLREDPEMDGEIRVPGFTILRRSDGLFDIASDELRPVNPGQKSLKPTRTERLNVPVLAP